MAVQGHTAAHERVIRPAVIVPGHLARRMTEWVEDNDVTRGGCWAHDAVCMQRYSGPFDGASGMRGSAVLLGSIHIMWARYDATIFRVNVTDAGVVAGMTVDELCDEVLRPVGLTLASSPRAELLDAPPADPFLRAQVPSPSPPTP